MKKIILLIAALFLTHSNASVAPLKKRDAIQNFVLKSLKKDISNKKEYIKLQKRILSYGSKSVPALIKIMKSADYPDKNRWVSTSLLGKIMGKKSAPFISKFVQHPHWVLRMASLKTLLSLREKKYGSAYAMALSDSSLIVRRQALDNIRLLGLKDFAPQVWAMLYDKKNYYVPKVKGKELSKKRGHIVKSIIRTVGDLKFEKAKTALLTMIQKKKYSDIYSELDYSLSRITGRKSPKNMKSKLRFWKKYAVSERTI